MRSLTAAQQSHILSLLDKGKSAYQISSLTGFHTSTISRLCSKHCSTLSKSIGGHPSKLSPPNIHYALYLITTQKAENAMQLTKTLQDITNQSISLRTVRRGLKKAGMKAVVKKKRPLLSKRHKKNHMDFALAHKDWTLDDWKRVIWSDETKINHLGSDGRKWVWKKTGEGTVKFGGGSVMVWGCMLWDGPGYACKIDGRMDGDLYVKIMEEDLKASMDYYDKSPEDVVFQQDNDPKHTCKKAKSWFQDSDLVVMEWPAQSPDLNPIEHLWSHLKKKLGEYENPPTGITDLWERVEKEWNNTPASVCQNLIENMPRRVAAVLGAKGGYTKY